MNGVCRLCLTTTDLKLGHVVPKFVWQQVKDPAPWLRTNLSPNQRIQDGPKLYLLCEDCEQRFSNWEKLFAEKVFLPLHDTSAVNEPIHYEEWALKFATSVSWRVLIFFMQKDGDDYLTPLQRQLANEALEMWRKFLMGEIKNTGDFTQHLVPVDVIRSYKGPKISAYLNRYLFGGVHIEVMSTQNSVYVYTKMCKIILFGRIQEKHQYVWKNTQLRLRRGDIRPQHYRLPTWVAEYMNESADEAKRVLDSMSQKQQDIVDSTINKNLDLIANSEIFRAMKYDVMYSGKEAFRKRTGGS